MEKFLNALASSAPAPGGGGGAAMAGALAAALSSMVANLTIGKEKFAAQEAQVQALLKDAEELRAEMLQLVSDDAEVFNSFMACYKLPKATEAEKAARTAAIRAAAKKAAAVPLAIAEGAGKVLVIADKLTVLGNPGVITDAACSAILARAALRCAEYNVRINLNLTKDDEFNAAALAKLETLQNEALRLENNVLKLTDAAIS
ncbi:cyclodeaminase/cyclohydrolase family protein [Phascolarctobacterium sp.]|uniref:cyclodeaminase/cyclohydrolase family protein n=1 Tax=Phascolarctobacterium sp. TaxID=2049039 RepID=UPI003870AE89